MITLVTLLACDGTPPERPYNKFVDVFEPILTVNAGNMPPRGSRVQVIAHAKLASMCRELPELKADINGVPLTRLHGKVDDGVYVYDRDCNIYEFEGDAAFIARLPASEESVVTVTDGVTSISTKTRHLFAQPKLTVEKPEMSAGSEVVMRWSPGGDVVNVGAAVTVSLTQADAEPIVVKEVKASAETITFTLPPELKGDVQVDLYGTRAFNPPVLTCVGATTCEVSRVFITESVHLVVR